MRRHAEEIAVAFSACFEGPGASPALARYLEMGAQEREYQAGLLFRSLMESVRAGTKGGFMVYCRELAEHRHRQGYRVEELVASRQAIHDYLAMTVEFGIDQIQEVFEEHEVGTIAGPER